MTCDGLNINFIKIDAPVVLIEWLVFNFERPDTLLR